MDIVERPNLDAAWKLFYGDGLTLGEIAEKLGCGIYDLSPWLTAPAIRSGLDGAEKWMERYEAAAREIERLRARVLKLESRLEIDHAFDGAGNRIEIPHEDRDRQYDGIECRDETIKLLEANVERLRSALAAETEECAKVAEEWMKAGTLRLHMGELSAQEVRTAQAIQVRIASAIRGRK